MFISEIPVRCSGDKTLTWVANLTSRTTVRDIIDSVLPSCESKDFALYISTGRHRQLLIDTERLYKVVAAFNQQQCARRLLFELRPKVKAPTKKRVRFADEITVQDIQGRCVSDEKKTTCELIETVSLPMEKRLAKLKDTFQKQIQEKQENYVKLSKRPTLRVINDNVPRQVHVRTATIKHIVHSSSESGISSSSSNDDLVVPTGPMTLETLV